MYSQSLRTRITGSTLTLPVTAAITLLTWLLPYGHGASKWAGLLVTCLSAYALVELNNRFALLRIRSRMVSASFLTLMSACPALHSEWIPLSTALLLALSYFMLFASYQDKGSQGCIFHAFLFVGVASILYPPMLVLAVLFYFSMIFQLRNFTVRTMMAGLLGIAVPYWLYAAYSIWENKLDTAFLYLEQWLTFQMPDYTQVSPSQWVTAGTLTALSLFAFVHFSHTAYNDKIRTRMFFYVISTQEAALAAGLVLLPQYYEEQLALLLLNSSPLLAHYYTLAKGHLADVWFYLSLLALVCTGFFNYLF